MYKNQFSKELKGGISKMNEPQIQEKAEGQTEKKAVKEVTKEDYQRARESWAARLINIEVEKEAAEAAVKFIANKINSMPDDDPMPKDVKEILK